MIEELNFVPNTMAASMVNKKTHMIAVVVPEIQNPFYTAVIGGTVEAAKKEGFSTLVVSTYNDEAEEEEFFEGFLGRNVDGIILIGTHKEAAFYRNIRKPTILVDRFINDCGHDGVLIDNFRGPTRRSDILWTMAMNVSQLSTEHMTSMTAKTDIGVIIRLCMRMVLRRIPIIISRAGGLRKTDTGLR